MSVCNCGHGRRFHSDQGCRAYDDYTPCCCRVFDPQQWMERYDTDEYGMLLDDTAPTGERMGVLNRVDESVLRIPRHRRAARIVDVHLPE